MWSASRDLEVGLLAALLCHVGLLYAFQLAIRSPVRAPEKTVIELALVPAPSTGRGAPAARAPVEVPRPVAPSPLPQRPPEIRAPARPVRAAIARKAQPPEPAPAEVPAPAPSVPSPPDAGAAGAVVHDGGMGIGDGGSSEAGSGATTTRAEPGVRARPRYRSNPEPIYPASARLRRQEGLVLLRVDVAADGRASGVALEKSSGVSALDEAALEAVRGWEFEPARVGARAVASRIEVPVRFKLAD